LFVMSLQSPHMQH